MLTIAEERAYLFYLTSEGGLATVVLGPLPGGEYREMITDGERSVCGTSIPDCLGVGS